ncbi:MAG: bifunctional DNA primase/polymerase [Brevinematia bacterium]
MNYLSDIIKQKEKLSSVQVFSIPILLSYNKEKGKVEKKPVLKGWTNISSGEDLENYWDLCIDALEKFSSDFIGVGIGVLTGRRSNLTVIDVDNLNIFREKLSEDLIQKLFAEASCVVKTARGGYHFYFAYCEELKQGTYQAWGFDVRNDGGFVVAPPSELVVDKKIFRWEWVKEDFENLKPIPLDILQALVVSGAVKWEGEEETKEEIYIEQEELLELASILRELWLRKYITGYDIDTGVVGGLVRSNFGDEEIFQLTEEIFKEEFSHKRTQYMIDRVKERLQKNIPFRSWGYLKSLLNNLLKSETEQEAKELAEKALKILSNKKKESRNSFILTLIRKYTERLKIHKAEIFSRNDEFYISLVAEGKRGLAKVEMKLDDFNKRNKFINLFLRFTARKPNEIEPFFKWKKTKEGFKKVYLFQWEDFVSFILERARDIGERGEKEEKYDAVLRVISEAPVEDVFKEAGIFSIYYDKDKQRYYISLSSLLATIQNKLSLYGLHMNLKELVDYLYKMGAKPCLIRARVEGGERKKVRVWDITNLFSKISSWNTSWNTSEEKCSNLLEARNNEASEEYTWNTSEEKCSNLLEARNDEASEEQNLEHFFKKFSNFSDVDNDKKIFLGESVPNSLNVRNDEAFGWNTSFGGSVPSVPLNCDIRNNGTSKKNTWNTSEEKCSNLAEDVKEFEEFVSFDDDEEELL